MISYPQNDFCSLMMIKITSDTGKHDDLYGEKFLLFLKLMLLLKIIFAFFAGLSIDNKLNMDIYIICTIN